MRVFRQVSMWISLVLLPLAAGNSAAADVHLAMGFRIGEVTSHSAIVWTRCTAKPQRLSEGERHVGRAGKREARFEDNLDVAKLHGEVNGAAGELRLSWSEQAGSPTHHSPWVAVDQKSDFVHQFQLDKLKDDCKYWIQVEARPVGAGKATAIAKGKFRTAARANQWQDVTFTVVTGQAYKDLDHHEGFHIYPAMSSLKPDFIVPTGDTVYYDSEQPRARTLALARHHWHRMYSLPRVVRFHSKVPGYWEKDDHDTYNDDGWPGQDVPWMRPFTFAQGQALFREQVPMGAKTFRTVRWGKGLQIWFVEGRDFRSPNRMPDGPDKTIWGKEQLQWLKKTVAESDADYRILISPTPIVGPDRGKKNDNHSNKGFKFEGDLVREWAGRQKKFYVCCGDRHWQYMSLDPVSKLREFSCGPASDKHAGGSPGKNNAFQPFHRVKGGFLSVSVTQRNLKPKISFRFHDVNGRTVYEFND